MLFLNFLRALEAFESEYSWNEESLPHQNFLFAVHLQQIVMLKGNNASIVHRVADSVYRFVQNFNFCQKLQLLTANTFFLMVDVE